MNSPYGDILVGLIATILSFDFMYKGWIMLRQKRKILIWPARIIFSLVSLIFGSDVAERRKEIFLRRARFYEISALLGGGLGFIGGFILLVSAILSIS